MLYLIFRHGFAAIAAPSPSVSAGAAPARKLSRCEIEPLLNEVLRDLPPLVA